MEDPGEEQVQAGLLLLSGLTAASLLAVFILRARRRRRRPSQTSQEKTGSAEEDFEDINSLLQTDLKNKVIARINQVKSDIKARKLQRDQNVSDLLTDQEKE